MTEYTSRFLLIAALVTGTTAAAAQNPPPAQRTLRIRPPEPTRQEVEIAAQSGEVVVMTGAGAATFDIMTTSLDPSHVTVKDAPYSADASNEIIQTLADGNRIVRKSSSALYRDAAGRTRREQSLAAVGPVAASTRVQPVVINDPVAGVNYVLDPERKTARRMRVLPKIVSPGPRANDKIELEKIAAKVVEEVKVAREGALVAAGGDQVKVVTVEPMLAGGGRGGGEFGSATVFQASETSSANTKTESLGTRSIEGVECEGTRTVTTIPAGEIGNDLPIQIVSERWYSPELKIVVLTKRTDPRFGETVYRLLNIVRAEPDASLFQVPSDYTVSDARSNFSVAKPRQQEQ